MSSNPYIYLLQTAWRYARNERSKFVFTYALFTCYNILIALHPILFGWFVEKIQTNQTQIIHYTGLYVAMYLGITVSSWMFHGPARVMERRLAFNMSRNFLNELYHQSLHLSLKWHQDHHSGATINRIKKASEALKSFFQNGFQYLNALYKFIFSFAAIIYFSPFFGFISVCFGALIVFVIFQFDKPYIKSLTEVNEKEHIVSSTLFDSLSNIVTVITLRLERSMQSELMNKVRDIYKPFMRNVVINEWKWFASDVIVSIMYAVVAFGYIYQHWQPNTVFSVSGLIILLGYINLFSSTFYDIAWQYTEIVQHSTDIRTASDISESFNAQNNTLSEITLPDNWQTLDIEHLNFSYKDVYDTTHPAQSLHDINIRLERGKKVAFIGESGSGKSTILALIRGVYQPENYELRITNYELQDNKLLHNGQPTLKEFKTLSAFEQNNNRQPSTVNHQPSTDFPLSALNNTVTLMPQEPEIFENTILHNITLGLPFTDEEVQTACDTAQLNEVIKDLPNGLASNIQEKGVNLSGGQKQRLALARGILAAQNSTVVLLDEPTSSVDQKTEMMIYEKLFTELKDKAIASSLHRLHLLTLFDYVYILKAGRIVDEGTFEYLKSNSLIFQDLWKHQTVMMNDE